MAQTYAQRKASIIKALRDARKAYRKTDTAGERLEREFDRMIRRKTLILPEQLYNLSELYVQYGNALNDIQWGLQDAIKLSAQ